MLSENISKSISDSPLFAETDIDLPFSEFTLPNGLRLIVHEDHKAPIVAVNVWYHVGSKNERPGKSGFAHLFEHLMFNGSEHFNDDYFQALLAIGATDLNGTTSHDRTNYFQNVPTAALDRVLWLESDRMGHFLGALDQAKLDEQRGVVQNEKRQRENVPYGREQEIITQEMFPPGHPYSWTLIGSMEDLDNASLEDCRNWFTSFYGAANAVLVIAGDVEPGDIYKRVLHYFGDIQPGPSILRPQLNIPKRSNSTRTSYQDRVPESRIVAVWNTPQLGSREDALLSLAGAILGGGKNSRMYKTLVYERQIATSVSVHQASREIASNFHINVNVRPGNSVVETEAVMNEILDEFLEQGPSEEELFRVRAQYFASFIKGMERIGGFGGKSDILASSAVFGNSPDAYKRYNKFVADATPEAIRSTCRTWLSHGRFTLTCNPLPAYQVSAEGADRSSGLPELSIVQSRAFPVVELDKLENGIEIILAQRKGVPTVIVEALIDTGYANDGLLSGLASLTMSMLDEGTRSMSALEINEQLQLLGASLHCAAGLDHSYVRLSTVKQTLAQSLALFGEILVHPTFPQEELERLKQTHLSAIQREKVNPMAMALRVVPKLLFGNGHRYSQPLTGTGYESSLSSITQTAIVTFYESWIRSNNARLIVVGDVSMGEIKEMLSSAIAEWSKGVVPESPSPKFVENASDVLYFLDRPDSSQSILVAGYLVEGHNDKTAIAEEHMNDVLGGQFISRINLNLREDKHWTYGSRSFILDTKGQRPFLTYASVQGDKTLESIQEIKGEFFRFVRESPVTEVEFQKNKANSLLALPGQWETNAAVADSLTSIIKLRLPEDYYQTYPDLLRRLSIADVHRVSQQMVRAEALSWFVVGDAEKVLPVLKKAGFQKIVQIDLEGNEVATLPVDND